MKNVTLLLLALTFSFATGMAMSNPALISSNPVVATPATTVPDPSTVHSAFKEFMNLTRHERKERINEVKSEIKNLKAAKKAGDNVSTNQVLLIVLAIILPPLAVYLHEGEINTKFWLDLLLTLLFFLPGIIYALIVVLAK